MAQQQNWRWCNKCKSIHYDQIAGVCAAGGTHDASTSMWYAVPTTTPTEVTSAQGNWRKCSKCQVLFYGTGTTVCPKSGAHDGSTSPEYFLATAVFPSNGGQSGWLECTKCLQVIQPYQGQGNCAAGGVHDTTGSASYQMKLGYPETPQISATFGGPGGQSFNDSAVLSPSGNFGPIRQIFLRAGDWINSIGVGYANGIRFVHGTSTGGNPFTITLDDDEFITSVTGRAGDYVNQLTFQTTKRTYGPYGGPGGNPFSVNFLGCPLQYLFGRSNDYVDQIGFGYGKQLGDLPGTISRSPAMGGTSGNPFDDLTQAGPLIGKIKRIVVRHDQYIDSLKVLYSSGNEYTHGGGGGAEAIFEIGDDEWITEIRGRSGTLLDSVQFVLSSGRMSPIFGGTGGAPFTLKSPRCVITSFFGRSDDRVYQLGACYDTARPKKVRITSITYDVDNFKLTETPKALTSIVVLNNSNKEQTTSSTLTDEVSESETTSVSITRGNTIEIGLEIEAGLEFAKVKQSVKYGYSLSVATSTEHTSTRTRSISHQVTTLVGPGSSIKATARVTEGTYNIPWTAIGIVTYINGEQSLPTTLYGQLNGVQCYGQTVVYENI